MRTIVVSVVLLAFASLAALAACGGKKKQQADKPPDIDGLAALGQGVTVVVGGDVEKLVASRLVRRGVAAMLGRDADLKARVEAIVSECELAPGDNIDSFIIGLGTGPSDLLLVLSGSFEENALTACAQKRLSESGGRLVAEPLGARTTYRAEGGSDTEPVWFALGSSRTLILAGSPAWLAKGLGEGPRLADDAAMSSLIASAPAKQTLWAAGLFPEAVAKMLVDSTAGSIAAPVSMTARADFVTGIQVALSAEMASEKDANTLKSLHKLQAPMIAAMAQAKGLGRLASKILVDTDGKYLKVRLEADEAELSELLVAVDSAAPSQQNPPSPEPDSAGPQGDIE